MKINILDEASAELDDAFQYYELTLRTRFYRVRKGQFSPISERYG